MIKYMIKACKKNNQSGAALIVAILLMALITILSASWLARFDSQLRILNMQRMGTQTRWLLRGAIDWAKIILADHSDSAFYLQEKWAIPIASTRITDISGSQEAYFSGKIIDAQSRFNLYNWKVLAIRHNPMDIPNQPLDENAQVQLDWGKHIMQKCGLSLAQTETWLSEIQRKARTDPDNINAVNGNIVWVSDILPFEVNNAIKYCLDLNFVWLEQEKSNHRDLTLININTVDYTVLSAHPYIGEAEAKRLLAARQTVSYIKDINNIQNSLTISNERLKPLIDQQFDVKSQYFLATGRVTMGPMDMMATSLLYLEQYGTAATVMWTNMF